jgi:hypothetical protein
MSGIGGCTSCGPSAAPAAPRAGAEPADLDGSGTVSGGEQARAVARAPAEAERAAAPQSPGFAPETGAALLRLQEAAGQG